LELKLQIELGNGFYFWVFFSLRGQIYLVDTICDRTVEEFKRGSVDAEKIYNIPYMFNTPEGSCNIYPYFLSPLKKKKVVCTLKLMKFHVILAFQVE
jgi:hypothetical protein